jgi:hypothetical protein
MYGRILKNLNIEKGSKYQVIKSVCLRFMLLICFLLPAMKATAPGLSVDYLLVSEPVNPYERLISAIVMVESMGDTLAVNLSEKAYGAFQIRPIRLLDYNKRTGKNYTNKDCLNFEISKKIFLYYAENMSFPDYQSIARKWNGSGKMTLVYWGKVKKYL